MKRPASESAVTLAFPPLAWPAVGFSPLPGQASSRHEHGKLDGIAGTVQSPSSAVGSPNTGTPTNTVKTVFRQLSHYRIPSLN